MSSQTTTDVCSQGHPWNAENTARNPDGGRYCRACQRLAQYRRRQARKGHPCTGCKRTGLYIGSGGYCITCARRRAKGQPLDTPIVRSNPNPPKPDSTRARRKKTKPAPQPINQTASRPSRLPAGWDKPATPKKSNRTAAQLIPEIGPVPPTAPETAAAALDVLRHYQADDLAEILGLNPEPGGTP